MIEFYELLKKDKKYVIGLMSGTSVDGIDAAIVEITGHSLETEVNLIAFETFPFPPDVPRRILALCQPDTSRVDDICEMNFYIGHLFAEAVKHILQKSGMRASDIHLIGSHGQTIHHLPDDPNTIPPHRTARKIKNPSTLQIGEPAVIAHETGIPTIADFRVADMAAGGQGAPLVSYPDYLLFRDSVKTVGLLNIGGIANLTVLPANGSFDSVSAADTGPGNMCIDAVVNEITDGRERYDKAGQRAAQGTPYQPLINEWLKHPFFHLLPPKTTGRETFGNTFAMECLEACRKYELVENDCIATLTELTVQTIADYIKRFGTGQNPIDTLYVSGGGVHNQTIMQRLSEVLVNTSVEPVDNSGISADAKEAIAFAILANESLHGQAGNLPSATGASVRKILGKFVCP
ncbi:MAG: anhydro-N-acetylmuramic acid kinase [Candidatus Poribacteria bacterium]|nr:anhydro-N-acetylmuramic acid kinase [Candidatus Poribacteria bacterium]